jgi:D-alanyl-D-alanine carboxypeptidase/D-alanyl-D-alanine-endopeptidase (penicillin-binding protein 4)
MKHNCLWRNSLGVVAVGAMAWSQPTLANELGVTTGTPLSEPTQSVEIHVPPPEKDTPNNFCKASLSPVINGIIRKYPNNWGILVKSLDNGQVLYSHNANKFFIPASNNKILTTAAALQVVKPQTIIKSSISLTRWVRVTNLRSNNYYADTLLRFIGGPTKAKAALTRLGVNPKEYRQRDGSGLSRRNLSTPNALVATLEALHFSPQKELFYSSLPIAGISGTLRRRMNKTPAQGVVYAKTGTLRGVRALSGYLRHPQYGTLAFSIIGNNGRVSGSYLVRTIDRIVVQMTQYRPCTPELPSGY